MDYPETFAALGRACQASLYGNSNQTMTDLFNAANRCPACLSWQTFDYSGVEFRGCHLCGTIAARDRRTTAVYDARYVAERYDRYLTTRPMSILRYRLMDVLLDLFEALPRNTYVHQRGKLLDVGYGNGDFLRYCEERGWDTYGNDVNPTSYPGVRPVSLPGAERAVESGARYRVVTFFDALEHFEDLETCRWVSHHTDWIIASFPAIPPEFPYKTDWKHYRPGEHHLYFEPQSLARIFSHNGVKVNIVYWGSPEDAIRGKRPDGGPNITTVALRCNYAER